MTCPYSQFAQATIKFCEDRLCHWVVEPANTWSNIGYLIMGLLVLRKAKGSELAVIGWSAIAVFIGSTLFHATATLWAEFLDLSGMYLFSGLMVSFNAKRLGAKWNPVTAYLSIAGLSIAAMGVWPEQNIPIFAGVIALAVIMEIILYIRNSGKNYKHLWMVAGFFGAAFFAWWLDISGVWCNPDNHYFNGHAFWHISNSFCFYYLLNFYRDQGLK
jgi:hypothetical protein